MIPLIILLLTTMGIINVLMLLQLSRDLKRIGRVTRFDMVQLRAGQRATLHHERDCVTAVKHMTEALELLQAHVAISQDELMTIKEVITDDGAVTRQRVSQVKTRLADEEADDQKRKRKARQDHKAA